MAWSYLATNQYGSVSGWGTNQYDSYVITQNQIDNATMMWNFFRNQGYTEQATAAMIGNAMWESLINPGQYEYGSSMTDFNHYGLGLYMWTPKYKIRDYATSIGGNMYDGDVQCQFYLANESDGWKTDRGLTQYPNYPYNMTPAQFKVSQLTPNYLAEVFGCNYEGGTYSSYRGGNADYWYNYFSGTPPTPPTPGGDTPDEVLYLMILRNRRSEGYEHKNRKVIGVYGNTH